jgi:hypothetical protein
MRQRHTINIDHPLDRALANSLGLRGEPGYSGIFTRNEAPETRFKNGSRVEKGKSDPDDSHQEGAQGVVLGSLATPLGVLYFVEFDDQPRIAISCVAEGGRLREAK